MMVEQQKQTTGDFVLDSLNRLPELSQERIKEIKMLNDATECLKWKKKFKKSETKVFAQDKQILEIMQRKAVIDGKNSSARNLVLGYLKDYPVTSEMEGLLKNVIRVLDPDPVEFTSSNGHQTQTQQQNLILDARDAAFISVQAGSSLDISKTLAQNNSVISAVQVKRCQLSVEDEVVQRKRTCSSPPTKSVTKGTWKFLTPNATNFSLEAKPLKIGQPSTGAVPLQNKIAQPLLLPTAGLQHSSPTTLIEKANTPISAEKSCALRKTTVGAIPGKSTAPPAQLPTLQLKKIDNEAEVKFFCKLLLKNSEEGSVTEGVQKLFERLKLDPLAMKLAIAYINDELLIIDDPKDIIEKYLARIANEAIEVNGKGPGIVNDSIYLTWRVTIKKIRETAEIGGKALKVMQIISFLSADNISIHFLSDLYNSIEKETDDSRIGENVFHLLKRLFLINSASLNSISVHPLVQKVNRTDLEEEGKFNAILSQIQDCTLKMMKVKYIPYQQIIHIMTIWGHVMTKRRTQVPEDRDCAFASWLCFKLTQLGKFREAFHLNCQAMDFLESFLDEKHLWKLRFEYTKGVLLAYMRDYSKSIELLTEVYKNQKELLGKDHKDCFSTAYQLRLFRKIRFDS